MLVTIGFMLPTESYAILDKVRNSKGRCSVTRFLKLQKNATGLAWRLLRKAASVVLIGLVLILSLFAGTMISAIFLHAVEF